MVQGKWTRELSCRNLIKDPAPKLLLPAQQKSQMATAANIVKEVGRISKPEGGGLQTSQMPYVKLLEVIFLNANTIGTEQRHGARKP